jgi:hypothetical protein
MGATWQPRIRPHGTFPFYQWISCVTQSFDHLHVTSQHLSLSFFATCCMIMSHQPYECAMCHPYSGDMCHSWIGPPVLVHIKIHVPFHVSCTTIWLVQSASMWHYKDCIDCTVNIVFPCLAKWTNHDIWSIWHPFELATRSIMDHSLMWISQKP